MVATPDQVESVLFGDDPAADALAPGAAVVVMATVGFAPVQRWAEQLGQQQVDLVDAPVSGGAARAAVGDLLIMVGGTQSAVARAQPLLDAMARSAPHVGAAPGDGQKVKLVNQLLCGVHIAAAAEALALAEAMALDPAATWEVLRGGAAASFMLDDRGSRMVHGTDEVKSALDIFVKDMGLVTDAARASSYPAPLASAAEQLYLAGHRAGLGRSDDSAVIEVLRGAPLTSAHQPAEGAGR
jgi:3-hydroxyisobutyrate dehydrogenase